MARLRSCKRCQQAYEPSSADPLCAACREQVAAWSSEERLTALAQQGFEEAMGMRPMTRGQFPGLPDDAGFRASRIRPSSAMGLWQVTSSPDGGFLVNETVPDYVIEPGQVRCRHCATALTATPDGTWADASGSAACFSPDIAHAPLPPGLDGSPA